MLAPRPAPDRNATRLPAAPPRTPRARAIAGLAGTVTLAGIAAVAGAPPAAAAPADQIRQSQQWVLDMLDVPAAWGTSQGSGVTVAVLDSGVASGVSDLTGTVLASKNETDLTTGPGNAKWGVHGTWMASIIAGHGHAGGGSGITGVAPEAKLVSVRVIPDKGDPGFQKYDQEPESAIQASLAQGIRAATAAGAKVISMSIGYSAPSSAVRAALQAAEQHGVVLVASSGNSGRSDAGSFAPVSFPAEYPGVLSVGAVNQAGAVASFSSDNLSVQVAAPGVNVPAQGRDGGYWLVSGTSPACALVAGVAALIKSRYPALSPALVDEALTSTARHGTGGYNEKSGFGTVDAAQALARARTLAARRPGKSPVASSGTFGGPKAVPAPPVPPRGSGQSMLFALLGLAALALAAGGASRIVILRRGRAPGPPWAMARPAADQHYPAWAYAPAPGTPQQGHDPRQGYGPGPGNPWQGHHRGHPGNGYPPAGYASQGYPQQAAPPRYPDQPACPGQPAVPQRPRYPQPQYPAMPQPPTLPQAPVALPPPARWPDDDQYRP
jgi:subtilisin family serine protease